MRLPHCIQQGEHLRDLYGSTSFDPLCGSKAAHFDADVQETVEMLK